jgi:ABC-2 type transport system permease protein
MKTIWLFLKNDLRNNLGQIGWEILIVLIGGCLFYLGLVRGIELAQPQQLLPTPAAFLSIGILVMVSFLFALIIAQATMIHHFTSGQVNNIRAANLTVSQYYVGISLIILVESLVVMFLLTALYSLLGEWHFRFVQILIFWLILVFGLYLAIQMGLLLSAISNLRLQVGITFLIILPLLLLSGVTTPIYLWQRGLAIFTSILPTTSLVINCRAILLENKANSLSFINLLLLNTVVLVFGIFIYKRKLLR